MADLQNNDKSSTIFCTQLNNDVKNAFDSRKKIYSAIGNRGEGYYNWLYKKTAYAMVTATTKDGKKTASLISNVTGGIPTTINKNKGLYRKYNPLSDFAQSNITSVYRAKPVLEAITITSKGSLGSIREATVKFKVFSMEDMERYLPLIIIHSSLAIKYGWSVKSNAAGRKGVSDGVFDGYIYNFNQTVTDDGGYDCTIMAMEKGINILGLNIDASIGNLKNTVTETFDASFNSIYKNTGQSGNPKLLKDEAHARIANMTLMDLISFALMSFDPERNTSGVPEDSARSVADSIFKVAFPSDAISKINERRKDIGAYTVKTSSSFNASTEAMNIEDTVVMDSTGTELKYITLEGLIKAINYSLKENTTIGNIFADIDFVCNKDITRGCCPIDINKFVSCNPFEVLFPGYCKYSDMLDWKFNDASRTDIDTALTSIGDLSKIMLNIDWLQAIFNSIGLNKDTADNDAITKRPNHSIQSLLKPIFDSIYNNSGERFELTLVSRPITDKVTNKTKFELLITDKNYIGNKPNDVYSITSGTLDSIVRGMSMSTKVPDSLQTIAYVAPKGSTIVAGSAGNIGDIISDSNDAAPVDADLKISLVNDFALAKYNALVNIFDAAAIKNLQASLKKINIGIIENTIGNQAIPFPIELSMTLDGIEGIVFGNTITTNYLPQVYKNSKIVWTITTITHNISNNNWTTELTTACRVLNE